MFWKVITFACVNLLNVQILYVFVFVNVVSVVEQNLRNVSCADLSELQYFEYLLDRSVEEMPVARTVLAVPPVLCLDYQGRIQNIYLDSSNGQLGPHCELWGAVTDGSSCLWFKTRQPDNLLVP